MKYKVLTKLRYGRTTYGPGELLPEDFTPDKTWIDQGIIEEYKQTKTTIKPKKEKQEDLDNGS